MPNEHEIRENYNEIVGVLKNGEVAVLETTFQYTDRKNFKGATGYTMRPMLQQYIDEMNEDESLREYWEEAVAGGYTNKSLEDWAEEVRAELKGTDDLFYMDDTSFRKTFQKAYDKLTEDQKKQFNRVFGEKGKDFVEYDSQSCGRCLSSDPDDYQLILNPDLLKTIAIYEDGEEDESY